MDPKENLKKLILKAKKQIDPEGAEADEKEEADEKLDSIKEVVESKNKKTVQVVGLDVLTLKGDKGDEGEKGDPGKDSKDGVDGIDGIDGIDGVGKDGKDGKDGIGGKDADPETVIETLKKLPEEKKLDITHLRNYQSLLPKRGSKYKLDDQRWHGAGSNEAIISFIIDGGGSAITTGIKGDLAIQFNCEVKEVELLADTTGSIEIDLWMADYASYPPTVANSITGSALPTITTGIKSKDTTLTGWTTQLALGDTLRYNVSSITDITRCLISLKVIKK